MSFSSFPLSPYHVNVLGYIVELNLGLISKNLIFPAFLSNREDINSAISCLVYYLRSQILLKCPTWKLRLARHVQDAARAKSG